MEKIKNFSQMFGIHPLVVFALFAADWMMFSTEIATIGTDWVITAPIGIILGIGAILVQKYSFKDETGLAIGKGILLGLLLAIPTALPSFAMLPFAAVGAVKLLSGKSSELAAAENSNLLPVSSQEIANK